MTIEKDKLAKLDEAIEKLQSGQRVVSVAHDGMVIKYAEVDLKQLIELRDKTYRSVNRKNKKLQIVTSKNL